MKTVPTLCATASVVGASAVGLSFGRELPFDPTSSSTKKKPTPARELGILPMSAAVHAAVTNTPTATTTTAISSTPTSSFSPRVSNIPRHSQDGRSPRQILRTRTSSEAAALAPSNTAAAAAHTSAPTEQDINQSDITPHTATRRPSWIKRLSTISNSQSSSRCPSPAPLSPSVSCSNGSMAFSHDGSTAPIIGKRSPSPLPPNKLVKRSSSVRISHDSIPPHSGSLRPSFRRPATSHQRSATLQHHVARLDITAEDPSLDERLQSPKTDSEIEYAHFFAAKITKERTLSKRRASSANTTGLRRIFPDQKHKATLVLARSVTAGGEEVDEIASDDGDSVFVVSRPGTPMSMAAMMAPQAATKAADLSQTHTRASEDTSRPRRSFSITDLLSSATGAKKPRISLGANGKLARRSSQRVSSAPVLPTMSKRRNSASHGEARRDLTNPALARHDLQTNADPHATGPGLVRNGPSGGSSESPSSALPVRCVDGKPRLASMPQLEVIASAVSATNQMPPSPTLAQSAVRPSRHSMAPSEHASTLVGSSDNEVRGLGSGDEDDADFQSDTLFDSLRTGATRSTSGGARGPRIETIFDESPPSKVKVTALRDLLPPGAFGDHTSHGVAGHHSIAEEEESITTPVRTVLAERSLQGSPGFSQTSNAPLFPTLISSSPPSMPKPLSLGTLEWDARMGDDDSSRWSPDEEEIEGAWIDAQTASQTATPVSLSRPHPRLFALGAESKPSTPQHLTAEACGDRDARSSIFDWSEQPTEKSSGNRTPPRPRTVHGKKDADRRGSRSVGRRAPSGLHARSQSVPVVPDATGKRNTVVTNKFGTWGVGSKGVTEDWNDDFDFSELVEDPAAEDVHDASKTDSGIAMVVPKTIQEQQNNVLANIGLLREWGLLIEELKEHRIRAIALGIVHGAQSGMWEEVDAMIDLADQEAEHDEVPRLSPPSSPGFDEDAFEDVHGNSPSNGRGRRKSGLHDEHAKAPGRRKSILPPNDGIFSPHSSPIIPRTEQKPIITRPRKDSEAKARSVIEALQQKRSTVEPLSDAPPTPSSKKVPFDTATLRRIVPYVNVLTRKVKDAIRDVEGLYSSPEGSPQQEEPSFNKIFQPDSELATQTKLMTVM